METTNKARRPRWTPKEDAVLVKECKGGCRPIAALAERLERSDASIRLRIMRLILTGDIDAKRTPQVWTPEEDARLYALRATGMIWDRVGGEMGRSAHSVRSRFRMLEKEDRRV